MAPTDVAYGVNLVGALAGLSYLGTRMHRSELRPQVQDSFLHFWISVYFVWAVYYVLKLWILVPPFEMSEYSVGHAARPYAEIVINQFSSTLIGLSAWVMSSADLRILKARQVVQLCAIALIAVSFVNFISILVFFVAHIWIEAATLKAWFNTTEFTSGFMGGISLVFFYRRLVELRYRDTKYAGIALFTFFSYAYLQAYYPIVNSPGAAGRPGHGAAMLISVCGLAAVLKVTCGIVAFRHAQSHGLQPPVSARMAASA